MTEEFTSPQRLRDAAKYYGGIGWKVLPIWGLTDSGKCACGQSHTDIKSVGKHPVGGNNLARATSDQGEIEDSWDGINDLHNVGVMPKNSGFFVIDIDPRSDGHNSFDRFEERVNGEIPPTNEAITGSYNVGGRVMRGRHLFYKLPDGLSLHGNLKKDGLPGIDIKHNGYVLLNPSKHVSGSLYQWKPGHAPWEMEMAEAPQDLLDALVKGADGGSRVAGASTSYYMSGTSPFSGKTSFGTYDKLDIDKVLSEGVKEGERSNTVYKLTCALANKYGVEDDFKKSSLETMMIRFNAEKIDPPMELEGSDSLLYHVRRAIEFVAANPKSSLLGWDTTEYEEAKKMVSKMTPSSLTLDDEDAVETSAGVILQAKVYDPDAADEDEEESDATVIDTDIDVPKDRDALTAEGGAMPGQRSMTDLGNGRRFADNFQNICRYTAGLGWYYWDKTHWQADKESLGVRELAKKVAPIIAAEVIHYTTDKEKESVLKWATSTKSSERQNATLKMAGSDPRLVVDVNTWDSYPTLLGVKNGVIDLKTGTLLKGRPDLYITRRAPVAYQEGLKNARWEGFLQYATDGDKEYEEWLQRAVGYTITGLSKLDIMFLIYGPPGTGKNTFIESVLIALGTSDYSWSMDSTILSDEGGSNASTDMYHWAELRGRRMVLVDELPDSGRLKENGVKKLTGSAEIPARSPGEKPFTFKSQAKLWISTNHRPIITDDAMWRRLRPVPWLHVPKTPDPGLKDYLSDPDGGLPAVLAWAVEGAMKVLNSTDPDPIGWCKVVREAHEDYKRNEDRIGLFLSDTTVDSMGGTISMEDLFRSYTSWTFARSERGSGLTSFIRKLKDRGEIIEGDGNSAVILNRLLKGDAEGSAEPGIPGVPATQGGKWGSMIAST